MKKLIVFAVAGVVLCSCSNSNPKKEGAAQPKVPIEITNDMENALAVIPSWVQERTVMKMTEPAAHSGEYACVTNDTIQYSYGYSELVKNISGGLPKTVVVTGWAYSTIPSPDFTIIFSTNENEKPHDYKAYPLKDVLKEKGKWTEFTATLYPDATIKPEYNVNIYAWNTSKKAVYLDDLKITFIY